MNNSEQEVITPDDGIGIEKRDILDDGNTVGLVDAQPGGETVKFEDARQAFATVGKIPGQRDYEVGDEYSTIFISSDGGELGVHYGPEFAPIETSIKVWQYELAVDQLGGRYPQFDLMFDDAGLVVFTDGETAVAVAPVQFPWDFPTPECGPRTPGGPTV